MSSTLRSIIGFLANVSRPGSNKSSRDTSESLKSPKMIKIQKDKKMSYKNIAPFGDKMFLLNQRNSKQNLLSSINPIICLFPESDQPTLKSLHNNNVNAQFELKLNIEICGEYLINTKKFMENHSSKVLSFHKYVVNHTNYTVSMAEYCMSMFANKDNEEKRKELSLFIGLFVHN